METLTIIIIALVAVAFLGTMLFFISKKKTNSKENKEASEPSPAPVFRPFAPKEKTLGARRYEKHNNRKTTKGRHVQYVELNGITKPIYHGAK